MVMRYTGGDEGATHPNVNNSRNASVPLVEIVRAKRPWGQEKCLPTRRKVEPEYAFFEMITAPGQGIIGLEDHSAEQVQTQ